MSLILSHVPDSMYSFLSPCSARISTSVHLHCSLALLPLVCVWICPVVRHSLTSSSSVRCPTGCLSILPAPACVTALCCLLRQRDFSIDLVSIKTALTDSVDESASVCFLCDAALHECCLKKGSTSLYLF